MKISKKEAFYEDLKQRVLTLDLPPGHQLDEVLLSEEYELSRTPLREVLQRVSGEGYISLEAHRSATVSSMDLATMRSFFQSAPMIYAAVARLATEQATQDQIATLKKIQSRFRKSVQKDIVSDMSMLNHQFHEQLGVMAATPYLTPSLGRLLIDHTRMSHRFYRVRESGSRKRIEEASQQHDEMIQSIEDRKPATTVELTIAHWELSRSEIDKYVLPDSLPMNGIDDYPKGQRS